MKITRNFGCGDYTFELTPDEIRRAYYEHEFNRDMDWMHDLLDEYGYDTKRITPDKVEELVQAYHRYLDRLDGLGIAEHQAFECAVQEFDFPELEEEVV